MKVTCIIVYRRLRDSYDPNHHRNSSQMHADCRRGAPPGFRARREGSPPRDALVPQRAEGLVRAGATDEGALAGHRGPDEGAAVWKLCLLCKPFNGTFTIVM